MSKKTYMHEDTIRILNEAGYPVISGKPFDDGRQSKFFEVLKYCFEKIKTDKDFNRIDAFANGYMVAKYGKCTISGFRI